MVDWLSVGHWLVVGRSVCVDHYVSKDVFDCPAENGFQLPEVNQHIHNCVYQGPMRISVLRLFDNLGTVLVGAPNLQWPRNGLGIFVK